MATEKSQKPVQAPKADSLSIQRRKAEVAGRNKRILTESKKQWLRDAKLAK